MTDIILRLVVILLDILTQYYMEETEDMLQKAEECIIRLEGEYSSADVNELFRIAHTIKGSSYAAGYDDIGAVMHKIEDMLDCVRNGSILFDQVIISLCFESLDIIKQMLHYKKEHGTAEMMVELINAASRNSEMVEEIIRADKKGEENPTTEQPAIDLVSSLLKRKPQGKNKYYVSFFMEDDTPMVSPVIIMVLKSIEDIGTLIYSSVSDDGLSGCSADQDQKAFDIILCTDIEEAELYTYFSLPYIERVNVVDITRSKLEVNDYYFNNSDFTSYIIILSVFAKLYNILLDQPETLEAGNEGLQIVETMHGEALGAFDRIKNKKKISAFIKDFEELFSHIRRLYGGLSNNEGVFYSNILSQMMELMERANQYAKGKYIFSVFKPDREDFTNRLRNFLEMLSKSSILIILIDLSNLRILHENEAKALIEVKKRMEAKGIGVGIIVEGPHARRIINILDSIKPVEEFCWFKSEFDAVLGMLYSKDSIENIMKKAEDIHYV